jgi:hypothetical protein
MSVFASGHLLDVVGVDEQELDLVLCHVARAQPRLDQANGRRSRRGDCGMRIEARRANRG